MAAALQIWSPTFSRSFDDLPYPVQADVQRKVDEMGTRLNHFPHQRLAGRSECKLRPGRARSRFVAEVVFNPNSEIRIGAPAS